MSRDLSDFFRTFKISKDHKDFQKLIHYIYHERILFLMIENYNFSCQFRRTSKRKHKRTYLKLITDSTEVEKCEGTSVEKATTASNPHILCVSKVSWFLPSFLKGCFRKQFTFKIKPIDGTINNQASFYHTFANKYMLYFLRLSPECSATGMG